MAGAASRPRGSCWRWPPPPPRRPPSSSCCPHRSSRPACSSTRPETAARSGSRGLWPETPGSPAQLSRPGSVDSSIRVGGYLGFAGSLNTALRGSLGHTLVLQVRAQHPSYWVGETFDTWQGQSWTESQGAPRHPLRGGSPFLLPVPLGDIPFGPSDVQTFYVSSATANLVFHDEGADELWFPTSKVYVSNDGTIVSPIGLGSGSIYTVESQDSTATPAQLRADTSPETLPPAVQRQEEQLPRRTPGCSPWPGPSRQVTRPPTPRCSRSSTGSERTPTTPWTSRPCRPVPTPWTSSCSATGSGSASRSRHRSPSCCARSASPPARRSATFPAATTPSRTSTRSTRTMPMPGCRCGSPGTAGRASTRRPSCRPPTRVRARWHWQTSVGPSAASHPCPWSPPWS